MTSTPQVLEMITPLGAAPPVDPVPAARRTDEADRVAALEARGFDLNHLFGVADDRGWSLAVSVVNGRIALHAFSGPPPPRSDQQGWLMPPVGIQLACAAVTDLDFATAARELYAMALEEWS